MRYSIILLLVFFFSCKQDKQNIILIVVDDLGWKDLGYTGSTFYETPNIDSFSKESIQFTNAYASASVCSPTRAAIMTGKHPARLKITDWIPGDNPQNKLLLGPDDQDELPLEEITIAEVLEDYGYKTFIAGKWHLGKEGFYPEDQGFNINVGGHEAGHPPNGYYTPYKNPKLSDGPEGEYLTDRLTAETIDFINNSGNDPFFVYLPYYTVHTPIEANIEYVDHFLQKLGATENPYVEQKDEGENKTTISQRNPAYASMVYALDQNIGQLINTLKERGLYENSIIIFTSDNGGLTTLNNRYNWPAPTSVAPLRAGKGWLYEGGIRVPLLIKPAHYEDSLQLRNDPVVSHDLFPTILSLAGIEFDQDKVDGINIMNQPENSEREIFWHYPHYHTSGWTPGAAIRIGDWKLVEFYETNRVELYNLSNDISESYDLSATRPDKTKYMKQRLHTLQDLVAAQHANENPGFVSSTE